MINRWVGVGRLTKDPELKYTQTGIAVCRFTLACNRPVRGESGEQTADFINCIAWRKQAENVANFLKKGSLVGVEGRITTGSYEKDGKRTYTTDITADSVQFLEPRGTSDAPRNSEEQQYGQQSQQSNQQPQQDYTRTNEDPFSTAGGPIEVSDDDLPF